MHQTRTVRVQTASAIEAIDQVFLEAYERS